MRWGKSIESGANMNTSRYEKTNEERQVEAEYTREWGEFPRPARECIFLKATQMSLVICKAYISISLRYFIIIPYYLIVS